MPVYGSNDTFGRTAFGYQVVESLYAQAGWYFPYDVNARLVSSAVTGSGVAPALSTNFIQVATSATINSSSLVSTRKALKYIPGIGGRFIGTVVFTAGVAGSTQEFGLGDSGDAFVFGFNGSAFGINKRTGTVDGWIAQTTWNVDQVNSATPTATCPSGMLLDPAKLNVYGISYQWLGGGEIKFYVENPDTGSLILVHRIKYANQFTVTSILNPQLPCRLFVSNTSNATNVTAKSPSAMAFCEGSPDEVLAQPGTFRAKRTGITTTESAVMSVQSPATINAVASRIRMKLMGLSIYADGAGTNPVTFNIRRGATLGGSPSYGSVPSAYATADVAATTASAGTLVWSSDVGRNAALFIPLDSLDEEWLPGEIMTVSAVSTATTFDGVATLVWKELF